MIPVNEPLLGKEELRNVSECVTSGWISSKGKYIKDFEVDFAKFCGVKFAVATTNGTTALHLALAALGITKGDEVIVPAFTMIATAYAVLYTGAKPVFIDAEEKTWNMDVSKIEDAITRRTKAILPVHIYGHPVDMDPVMKLAKKYRLFVVEDAAEAHGAEYKGKKCGSFGAFGCFSFYANKLITTGEGGMVVTNSEKLSKRAQLLKDLAHSPKKRFLHTDLAYNYRMTNMQAAVGLAQLKKLPEFIRKKRRMAALYNLGLKDIPGLQLPVEEPWAKSVYWMYSIVVTKDFGITCDALRKKLLEEGVDTRAFFMPMNSQPVIRNLFPNLRNQPFPVAERIARQGLYLPSGLAITDAQIRRVCKVLKKIQRSA